MSGQFRNPRHRESLANAFSVSKALKLSASCTAISRQKDGNENALI